MMDAAEENYFEITVKVFNIGAEMFWDGRERLEAESIKYRESMHLWVISARYKPGASADQAGLLWYNYDSNEVFEQ